MSITGILVPIGIFSLIIQISVQHNKVRIVHEITYTTCDFVHDP